MLGGREYGRKGTILKAEWDLYKKKPLEGSSGFQQKEWEVDIRKDIMKTAWHRVKLI